MLDKFLVLLERFVVAHELIAANSACRTVTETVGDVSVSVRQPVSIELPVEGEEIIDTDSKIMESLLRMASQGVEPPLEVFTSLSEEEKYAINSELYKFKNKKEIGAKKTRSTPAAKPEPEDDLADDEEPEEKPVRKAKAKPAPKEEPTVDITAVREDIKTIAKHIAAGESDQCADLFDELLEEYKVRTVTKLPDDVVEAFFKDAKTLVAKYYDLED